jgi:hypothetical protein
MMMMMMMMNDTCVQSCSVHLCCGDRLMTRHALELDSQLGDEASCESTLPSELCVSLGFLGPQFET